MRALAETGQLLNRAYDPLIGPDDLQRFITYLSSPQTEARVPAVDTSGADWLHDPAAIETFMQCDPGKHMQAYRLPGLAGVAMGLGEYVRNPLAALRIKAENFRRRKLQDNPEKLASVLANAAEGIEKATGFTGRYQRYVELQTEGEKDEAYWERLSRKELEPAAMLLLTKALEVADMGLKDIDVLIVGGSGGAEDMELRIRDRLGMLGMKSLDGRAYGVYMSCPTSAGTLYWLNKLQPYGANVAIVIPEIVAPYVDPTSTDAAILSDRGVAAIIPRYGKNFRVTAADISTFPDPEYVRVLAIDPLYARPPGWDENDPGRVVYVETERGIRSYYPRPTNGHGFQMDGGLVMEFAQGPVVQRIHGFCLKNGIDPAEVSFVVHPANGSMLAGMEDNLRKLYTDYLKDDHRYYPGIEDRVRIPFLTGPDGNNAGAAAWCALMKMGQCGLIKPVKDGPNVVAVGMGGGPVSIEAAIRWDI